MHRESDDDARMTSRRYRDAQRARVPKSMRSRRRDAIARVRCDGFRMRDDGVDVAK
jgi:hypothetical protein